MKKELQQNISIVIPVYNEVANVESLFLEIERALQSQGFQYEIIFVDDGSKDGTPELLEQLARQHAHLRCIRHSRNLGQSVALLTGVQAATFPIIVTMDGDGQNDPQDIVSLLKCTVEGAVVLGYRQIRRDNLLRKVSSRVGNSLRSKLLKDTTRDTGCSLKVFPKEAFLQLPHFNHFHRFLPALFLRAGYQLIHQPVNHRPRRYGVSKYGVFNRLFVGVFDLFGVYWLLKRPCLPEVIGHE